MRETVILGGVIPLLHSILVIAHKFEIDEAEVHIWEVIHGSSKLEKLEISSDKISFDSHQTFILLKIFHPRWSIFYWLGKETSLEQKLKTVSLVGELWHQIVKHPNKQLINKLRDTSYHAEIWYTFESTNTMFTLKPLKNFSKKISSAFSLPNRTCDRITPTIHRETETNESDLFVYNFERYATHFRFKYRQKTMELYEIKQLYKGLFITELIPLYSQTNENENVYILDKGNEVVKSGKIAFPKFKEIKKLLVYNLINEKLPNRMRIQYLEISGTLDNYIQTTELVNRESIPSTGRKILFKMYYHQGKMKFNKVNFSFEEIIENACFMLQNEIIRYIYVYTGRYADLNLIDAILVKAEEIYETQLWKKIIFAADTEIFTLDRNLKHPTNFWVNFDDIPHDFLTTGPKNSLSTPMLNSLEDFN